MGRRLTTISLSNIYLLMNFLTGRFLSKFAVKWIFNIPSHLAYVATLPCETLMSKLAISDKLQSSVATYLRCGGVVIKKGLFLIDVYLAKLQARAWLSHALCAPSQHTANRRRKCTRQSVTFLLVMLPNIQRF